MEENQKKQYELGFLVKEESEAPGVTSALKDMGAEVLLEGPVRKTALAYEIEKQNTALFGFVQFAMDPAAVKDLEAAFNMRPEILRFILVTPPASGSGERPPAETAGPQRPGARPYEAKPQSTLSNEALEKKIEEILQ
jgi:ribosomal protein S6